MTARELLGYWSNIPRLQAEEELRLRRVEAELTADTYFDLMLAATGNRERAERAFKAFRAAELASGETPK